MTVERMSGFLNGKGRGYGRSVRAEEEYARGCDSHWSEDKRGGPTIESLYDL